MAAAFLVDNTNQRQKATSAQFLREVEEEGIGFNIENTAEDIINGLFCTYEPPTSRMDQYRAAKAVRKEPEKYAVRPSVPKSILKWKVKKNIPKTEETAPADETETDAEAQTEANVEAESADEIMGEKKIVTWRDRKGDAERSEIEKKIIDLSGKYCGSVCHSGEALADIMSSPTGKTMETMQNFFATDAKTPGSMASKASALFGGASPKSKKTLYDDQGNLIREDDVKEDENRSYFPSTPSTVATSKSKAAEDSAVERPNLFCSNLPFMDTMKEGMGIAGVMAASAAAAAGVPDTLCNSSAKVNEDSVLNMYEPVSYDQPGSSYKFNRQSTPRRMPIANTPRYSPFQQADLISQQRKLQTPSNRSYATSDITMGNTTVKHFSGQPSPRTNFSSMLGELKQVQGARALNNTADNVSVSSKRSGYLKSPKSAVVTQSYLQSIKTPNNTGKVAEIAKQLDAQAAIRNPIDPIESRQFDGKMNFLPPTPRRPATPSSTVSRSYNKFDWDAANKFGSTPRSNNTDAEIREAASSVFETNIIGRRPVVTQKKMSAPAEDTATIAVNTNSKNKKEKKKGFFSKMRKVTKKVESQRIAE